MWIWDIYEMWNILAMKIQYNILKLLFMNFDAKCTPILWNTQSLYWIKYWEQKQADYIKRSSFFDKLSAALKSISRLQLPWINYWVEDSWNVLKAHNVLRKRF